MKRSDKGQVLVLVALAIFVLLGFAALGIDVGFMYSVRHELQRSADAGALAGASAFTTGKWDDPSVQGIAEDRARTFASKDTVVTTLLNSAEPPIGEVHVDIIHQKYDHIEVVTQRNADLFFARIFGMSNRLITARAVARAEPTDILTNCIKPFAIPYPWLDDIKYGAGKGKDKDKPNGLYNDNGVYPDYGYLPGETVYKDCVNPGPPLSAIIGLCAGKQMTIKVGNPSTPPSADSGQQTEGQFFIVNGNLDDSGNPIDNTWISAGELPEAIRQSCLPIDPTKRLNLMTGGKLGLTIPAIQALIDRDPFATYEVHNDNSPRVFSIAMYDPRISMVGGGGPSGGSGTQANIPGGYIFAGFFLERVDSPSSGGETKGGVVGRFLQTQTGGSSSGTTPGGPTDPKKVALVE